MTQITGKESRSRRGRNVKGGITMKQRGQFVLILGMVMGMSIVGCTSAVSEKPSVQPGRFGASQAGCTELRKSVVGLERALAPLESGTTPYRDVEAQLVTAQSDLAKCEAKGQ